MKKYLLTVCSILLVVFSFSQPVKLQEATPVKIIITKEISSKEAAVGDVVPFKVAAPVKAGEVIVIDSAAELMGEIIEVQKAKSLGRAGKLDFVVRSVKSTDGQMIRLRSEAKKIEGKKTTGGVVAAAVIFTPLALFIKGKNITIEAGREFLVYVDSDYSIEVSK